MSKKERHRRADHHHHQIHNATPMDKAVITCYVNSKFDTQGGCLVGQTVFPMFSDDDMKGLAETIAKGLGTPVDVMVKKQECFRRCYTGNSDKLNPEDQDTIIVGVATTGNINQTVCRKVMDYYSNADKRIRVVQDIDQAV